MKTALSYGRATYHSEDFDPTTPCRPTPLFTCRKIWDQGKVWQPRLSDQTILQLLKRRLSKQVSFLRAYRGWRASGAREERDLGEDRAFLRWLRRHELAIAWEKTDLVLHPYFTQGGAPQHEPQDEMAQGMSFAIAPVSVEGRRVKLYLRDEDVLSLVQLPYGQNDNFLSLVSQYVSQRHQWRQWQALAPSFIDWLKAQGKRPLFYSGQLGFKLSR